MQYKQSQKLQMSQMPFLAEVKTAKLKFAEDDYHCSILLKLESSLLPSSFISTSPSTALRRIYC